MRKCKIYQIDDAVGSANELYRWITAGLVDPPSKDTFRSRVRRGERCADSLRRPPDSLSDRGCAARREGARRYHEQRRRKMAAEEALAEAALLAIARADTEPRWTEPSPVTMKTTPHLPAAVLETLHCQHELPAMREWTGWNPAYIRPGALDSWPQLRTALRVDK